MVLVPVLGLINHVEPPPFPRLSLPWGEQVETGTGREAEPVSRNSVQVKIFYS